ncbi:hypothetical protein OsJ_17100 [Oryza sativa Japonica Group]|uniref:Uncharacterized protein n=1 Tax=Oryza sativa subsp. japonica TaxID=39947 RepID=B9FH69_ORYSJ|nr:hypothetical protein OsJ_17100 [Oryza sativa Japonica Group]
MALWNRSSRRRSWAVQTTRKGARGAAEDVRGSARRASVSRRCSSVGEAGVSVPGGGDLGLVEESGRLLAARWGKEGASAESERASDTGRRGRPKNAAWGRRKKPKEVKILSSAHCLDHLFTKGKPKSAQELDKLYQIVVICDHCEDSFRQDKAVNKQRRYSEARITEIDCEKDLMLQTVVCVAGPKGRACKHSHPALAPSKMTLQSMEKVLMVSWPPYRHRTVAVGEVSNCSREYDDISRTNLIGYDMTLAEVNIHTK